MCEGEPIDFGDGSDHGVDHKAHRLFMEEARSFSAGSCIKGEYGASGLQASDPELKLSSPRWILSPQFFYSHL